MINQGLAARMAYSFITYSNFIYEITVYAVDCDQRGKTVSLGLALYTFLITKSCCT